MEIGSIDYGVSEMGAEDRDPLIEVAGQLAPKPTHMTHKITGEIRVVEPRDFEPHSSRWIWKPHYRKEKP